MRSNFLTPRFYPQWSLHWWFPICSWQAAWTDWLYRWCTILKLCWAWALMLMKWCCGGGTYVRINIRTAYWWKNFESARKEISFSLIVRQLVYNFLSFRMNIIVLHLLTLQQSISLLWNDSPTGVNNNGKFHDKQRKSYCSAFGVNLAKIIKGDKTPSITDTFGFTADEYASGVVKVLSSSKKGVKTKKEKWTLVYQ